MRESRLAAVCRSAASIAICVEWATKGTSAVVEEITWYLAVPVFDEGERVTLKQIKGGQRLWLEEQEVSSLIRARPTGTERQRSSAHIGAANVSTARPWQTVAPRLNPCATEVRIDRLGDPQRRNLGHMGSCSTRLRGCPGVTVTRTSWPRAIWAPQASQRHARLSSSIRTTDFG
jgi:hypothetical protein